MALKNLLKNLSDSASIVKRGGYDLFNFIICDRSTEFT